ncbi:MAG: hypothetical protein QOK37_3036 [Thermoanaerobaculia bacterium]|jgi:hypothetical protein|nr:hypothetical protein [Thermoanaerobaculia bacterium]
MPLPRLPLFVSLLLIALIGAGAAKAGAEIPLAPPRFGPSSTTSFRSGTAVASSGHGYLVAWEEEGMRLYPSGTIAIRALDESGRPLRAASRVIAEGSTPSIAWNGREYLLVFGDRSRFGGFLPLPVAYMMRVSEDGTPIDQVPVVVSMSSHSDTSATSVAWDGAEYLVCWSGFASGAALVSSDLHIRLIQFAVGRPASVTSNGKGFLLASLFPADSGAGLPTVRLLPISATGEAGVARDIGPGAAASLTSVYDSYELLWNDTSLLKAARVTGDFSPTTLTASKTASLRVAAANGAIIASWVEYPHDPVSSTTRVCTQRLDIASQPVCSDENANLQHDPAIGVSAATFLLAWCDRTSGIDEVRIDVTPMWALPHASSEGRLISESAATQNAPAIERRPDGGIAAVWSETDSVTNRHQIRIGGLDSSGAPLPDRLVVPTMNDQYAPQIAIANGHTLVVWNELNSTSVPISAQKLGVVIDDASGVSSAPIDVSPGSTAVALAARGSEFLVASVIHQNYIAFAVIDVTGRMIRTGSIDGLPNAPMEIAVAATSKGFAIVWSGAGGGNRIMTSRLAASGPDAWQPSEPVLLDESATWRLGAPAVAVNGNRTLVTWLASGDTLVANEFRQVLLDEQGAAIGSYTVLSWQHYVYGLRARPTPGGFALLTQTALILSSLDGRVSGVIDLTFKTVVSDFLADGPARFIIAYARSATVDENLGVSGRVFLRTVEQPRLRSSRMR